MRITRCLVIALLASAAAISSRSATEPNVRLTPQPDRVRIEVNGRWFSDYIFRGSLRPYLYPVLGADGTRLTRDYPMADTPGEDRDHPHQRSLWFTHGEVNGVNFWAQGPGMGTIVNDSVSTAIREGVGIIESHNRWVAPDGNLVCTDDTTLRIHPVAGGRLLDYDVSVHAPADHPVVFADTKEGSMAIRLAQWLTVNHRSQAEGEAPSNTQGHIVTSEGARDLEAWGTRANWVDYFGPKDGKIHGVAIFDHPQNPRHPTWWHVRDYGLFAANPFGQHDFEARKDQPHLGDLTVPAGGSVTFRYRFYFHDGETSEAGVAARYREYARGDSERGSRR